MEVPEVAALQDFSQLNLSRWLTKIQFVLNQGIRSDYYSEAVGMATLILGKAFGGLDDATLGGFGAGGGATLDCFGVFSVGTGEDVR